MRTGYFLSLCLLAACSAADLSSELGVLKDTAKGLDRDVVAAIGELEEVDLQKRREAAAELGERWSFEGCEPAILPGTKLEDCTIYRGERLETRLNSDTIRRKWRAVNDYITALSVLASAENDTDLLNAYAAALKSLDGLADAAESDGLAGIIEDLEADRKKTEAAVRFTLKNARMRALRRIVPDAEAPFSAVVGEIAVAFVDDTEAGRRQVAAFEALSATQEAANAAARRGTSAAAAAMAEMEDELETFREASKRSIFYRLSALAEAHSALAARIARDATPEEIAAFLKELADLKETLEE